jgi:ferredoxin-nitrite reductase
MVSDRLGAGAIDITNRANVQIRGLASALPKPLLVQLQTAGLAAPSEVDHLRNIMASPTAGIDLAQLIDTRPLVRQLDEYLSSHAELVGLSPKFSVGLDGGERVSIRQQPNDIQLTAIELGQDAGVTPGVYFCLGLAGINFTEKTFLVRPEDCVTVVAAIAQAYLKQVEPRSGNQLPDRKPRLKQVLAAIDLENYLVRETGCVRVLHGAADVLQRGDREAHLGIHPQRNGAYIGIALPLGRLRSNQLRHLANLAEFYGSGSLRLSPWRNLLLPDIAAADLAAVQQALERLELSPLAESSAVWGGLVACSGTTGCASSATDTQADAHALAQLVNQTLRLDRPIAIHFSGCAKSCAHHGSSDVTLVGTVFEQNGESRAGYDLYVGDRGGHEQPFGRQLAENLLPDQVLPSLVSLISVYQRLRSHSDQSFREFVDRYSLSQLRQWLEPSSLALSRFSLPSASVLLLGGGQD